MTVEDIVLGVVIQVAIVAALHAWGRWVAARQGGVAWRRAAWMPWVAFALGSIGAVIGVVFLLGAFAAVASVDPADKASRLAGGISNAMRYSAPFLLSSWALYVASVVAFLLGSVRSPRRLHAGDGDVG